ncbi:MAG: sulfatase-like hydrolase/transferase [Pseudohongiellaceae bacterium]
MMIRIKLLSLGLLLILLCGCGREQDKGPVSDPAASFMALNDPESDSANTPPNILLIIADDLGVEQLASFGIGAQPAVTPNLDQLASQGMSFVNVWSQPICSPTRATLLTGRYGFRTGVGTATPGKVHGDYPELARAENGGPDLSGFDNLADKPLEVYENLGPVFRVFNTYFANDDDPADGPFPSGYGLPINEYTLPEILRSSAANYSTGVIGKWHLGDNRNGWLQHPGNAGFDYFSVNMLNQPESFYAWYENVNGELEQRTGYTPEQKVDDAIDWLDEQKQDDKPWLLWLAFNLPHYPHHIPEVAGLETDGLDPTDHRSALDVMTSRMDQEIGRLLDAIGAEELENTIVLLVGDNGTTGEANDPPFHPERGKFTLYEGGIRVPLIISGPGIPAGAQSTALVNTTDIFATLVELSGNELHEELVHDSVSLAPYFDNPSAASIRDFMFADAFYAGSGIEEGAFTVRDDRFKLIRWHDHQELYDLENDPYENANLLEDGESEDERTTIGILERLVMQIRSI